MQGKTVNYLIKTLFAFLVLGMMGCGGARKIPLDPESHGFYETARLIMTKQEKDIFNHLPDQKSREEFIRDFWAKRDPDLDTEENEFKEEFFRRIEYANQRFKEGRPGWKTDRGRIYIYFGAPDNVEEYPFLLGPDIKGYILWKYYRYGFAIEFVDRRGDESYTLDPYSGVHGDFFWALEKAKFGIAPREEGIKSKFVDFDVEFNREKKEIVVSLPITFLIFKEEEGIFKADFEFEFFIYEKKDLKSYKFREVRHFEMPEEEVLQMEEINFAFPYDLNPGKYYFDVVIIGRPDTGKTRKIFEIKI